MKTCGSCRFFIPIEVSDGKSKPERTDKGECCVNPPRKSSERGHSYRPEVHRDSPACQFYSRPMPCHVPLPKAELIRLEVVASSQFTGLVDRLEKCAAQMRGSERQVSGNLAIEITLNGPMTEVAKRQPLKETVPLQGHWYCWHTQSAVVRSTMKECGIGGQLRAMYDAESIMGLSGGIFVDISNHPQQVPDQILALAERAGMMRVRMSDEWLRSKAERLMGR